MTAKIMLNVFMKNLSMKLSKSSLISLLTLKKIIPNTTKTTTHPIVVKKSKKILNIKGREGVNKS